MKKFLLFSVLSSFVAFANLSPIGGNGATGPTGATGATGSAGATGSTGSAGLISINPFGSSPNSSAASFSSSILTLEPADASHPGGVSVSSQSFGGSKTFTDTTIISKTNNTTSVPHFKLLNPSGISTSIDFVFGSTVGTRINSFDGELDMYAVSQYGFYTGPNIGAQVLSAVIGGGGITSVTGGGYFSTNVDAGAIDLFPVGTLNTYGSTAQKNNTTFTDVTLDAGQTLLLCDSSNNFKCGGTGTACSSYTYSQCPSHSVYGCTLNTTGNCSDYNGDPTTCAANGGNGCSNGLNNCTDFNNNPTGCSTAPTPSTCSFSPASCSDFADSQADCTSASGCMAGTEDCSAFSDGGGDGSACNSHSGCSYDSGSGVCSGTTWDGSCSGIYTGPNGSCSGNYYNGSCNGGSFGTCTGTGVCSNLTSSGGSACTASGCTYATSITVGLPPIGSGNVANDYKTGWRSVIKNIGSGPVYVNAYVTDSIEGNPSVTLSSEYNYIELYPLRKVAQCSGFSDEGSCSGTFPCVWNGSACTGVYYPTSLWLKTGGG